MSPENRSLWQNIAEDDQAERRAEAEEAQAIVGLFEQIEAGAQAVADLQQAGYDPKEISLLANEKTIKKHLEEHQAQDIAEVAGKGVAGGSVVGGLLGLLVGASTVMIPGIGPALATGVLATTLVQTAGGAALGGIAGGMANLIGHKRLNEPEMRVYTRAIDEGGVLIVVQAEGERAASARAILKRAGAVDLDARQHD